jgi:FecR-like protein
MLALSIQGPLAIHLPLTDTPGNSKPGAARSFGENQLQSIKSLIASVLCLLLSPLPAFCAAPDATQHAGQINGLIPQVQRNGAPTKLKDDVEWNDLLHTEHSGRVRAGLGDGSIISLGSDSEIRVVQHDSASQRTELELGFGKMRNQAVKITRPGGKYEVRTPLAVIGVIGTDFYVAHENNRTTVICYKGQVSVTPLGNARVTKRSEESEKKKKDVYLGILLNPGEMVEIGVDSLPDQLKPTATPPTVQRASIEDTSLPDDTVHAAPTSHKKRNILILTGLAVAGTITGVAISQQNPGPPLPPDCKCGK